MILARAKRPALIAVTAATAAALAAGCTSHKSSGDAAGPGGKVVTGGTFTLAMSADPGNLDPQASAATNLYHISEFAYDHLVNADVSGKIVSGVASSWKQDGRSTVFTMHKGVTCSDGSAFTAADAAANVNYITDPKSKSPFRGVFLPADAHATADEAAGTVTITTEKPAPFLLNGVANVPLVCKAGLADRGKLAHQTDGTGAYQLTESVPGDHYTYAKRAGYTWGPAGASTATPGMPDKVVVKIIPNETTAANLLLSGGINAAAVVGPDAQRLKSAGLFAATSTGLLGEMWFNHAAGRPTADAAVRQALSTSLDYGQLTKVLTSGQGTPATAFAVSPPAACQGSSVPDALPKTDLAKARQLLDDAGWQAGPGGVRSKDGKELAVSFVYNSQLGTGGSAAAELAAGVWKQLGVKVSMKAQDETAMTDTMFSTGNWDIGWEWLNVNAPDQLVPFLSGTPAPDGTNFAHIDNAAYNRLVAQALTESGSQSCPQWLKAEAELVRAADVIPFANMPARTFGYHATFEKTGSIIPSSIRMTG